MKIKENKKKNGISLIVLIITIAIIIILASAVILSIANNRPIESAKEATSSHNDAVLKESAATLSAQWEVDRLLDSSIGSRSEYVMQGLSTQGFTEEERARVTVGENGNITVILDIASNQSQYLEEAKALGQSKSTDIGIGTDGKIVNLDLWEYELSDGSISLAGINDGSTCTPSYKGRIIEGRIEGTIPKMIYLENTKKTYNVTNLEAAFASIEELQEAPVIPDSVINMEKCFMKCHQLTKAPIIPNNVMNMYYLFYECSMLTGDLIINANPTNYEGCLNGASTSNVQLYLSGTSNKLREFLNTTTSGSHISLK